MDRNQDSPKQFAKKLKLRFGMLILVMLGVALMRLIPHPPNFTPVAAMALFGGAYFDRRIWAFIVPLGAMLISDIALELSAGQGFHSLMPVVYGTFALILGMGFLLRQRSSLARIFGMTAGASVLFFATTNFAVWISGDLYPRTIDGLVACYVAAIPFFGNTIMGNLFYVGVLFGGWTLAESRFPALAPAPKTTAVV